MFIEIETPKPCARSCINNNYKFEKKNKENLQVKSKKYLKFKIKLNK